MLVFCWGIHASQQPTDGTLDNTCISMWDGEGEEAAILQPQRLPVKCNGQKEGTLSNRTRGVWPDGSRTAVRTKTEVPVGKKLGVENVEIEDTYLGTGGLHIRDNTTILIHVRHKGTKNAYRPLDGLGSTHWRGFWGTPQIQQGADYLAYHESNGGYEARGRCTLYGPEE